MLFGRLFSTEVVNFCLPLSLFGCSSRNVSSVNYFDVDVRCNPGLCTECFAVELLAFIRFVFERNMTREMPSPKEKRMVYETFHFNEQKICKRWNISHISADIG